MGVDEGLMSCSLCLASFRHACCTLWRVRNRVFVILSCAFHSQVLTSTAPFTVLKLSLALSLSFPFLLLVPQETLSHKKPRSHQKTTNSTERVGLRVGHHFEGSFPFRTQPPPRVLEMSSIHEVKYRGSVPVLDWLPSYAQPRPGLVEVSF